MSSPNRKNNTIDCSNVVQPGNKPILNSKFSLPYSMDIAPVHSSTSKATAIQKDCHKSVGKSLHWNDDQIEKKCNLSSQCNEKFDVNTKSNAINGTNIITTNAEVHQGQTENAISMKEKSISELTNNCRKPQCAIVSQEKSGNSPSSSQYSNLSNNFASSCKIQDENSSILKCKEKFAPTSDGLCNGYSVSEATSCNSIAVSDLSMSSEKTVETSVSFSAASKKWLTNDHQNQQYNDIKSSFGSDSHKSTDINFSPVSTSLTPPCSHASEIIYVNYLNENQMSSIMKLIQKDLSEPYSIYTYRYFIHNWPKLCFLALHKSDVVGAIVCKLDMHKKTTVRGYIAMLAVDENYRKKKIGSNLVLRAIRAMATDDADEVVLETEITNQPALKLYENLGFVRDKRLFRYYLNGVDALRLKLWLR